MSVHQLDDGRWIVQGDHIVHCKGGMVKSMKTAFKKAKESAGITRKLLPSPFRHLFATAL